MGLQRRGGLQGPIGPIGLPGSGGSSGIAPFTAAREVVAVNVATTWTTVFVAGDAAVTETLISNASDTGVWFAFTDEPEDPAGEGVYLAPGSLPVARSYSGPLKALHVGPSGTKQVAASRF